MEGKQEKVCIGCERRLSIDEFPKNPNTLDGHEGRCKACKKSRKKEVERQKKEGTYINQRGRKVEHSKLQARISENPPKREAAKGVDVSRLACALRVVSMVASRIDQSTNAYPDAGLVADVYAEMQSF